MTASHQSQQPQPAALRHRIPGQYLPSTASTEIEHTRTPDWPVPYGVLLERILDGLRRLP